MYCEVILSQRFPKHLGIFDYHIPDALAPQIKLGQLLTIPFRKSEYEGVVIALKKTTDFAARIKDITKINQPEPILTPEQIKLAQWMSDYYFVSLGTIVKMMLPPIPKTKRAQKEFKPIKPAHLPPMPSAITDLITQCAKNTNTTSLFWPSSQEQHTQFMSGLLKKIKGQILIIAPEFTDITQFLSLLPTAKQKETAIIHSQLNKTQFFSAWQRIISGQATIIIGTKLALFAPLIKPAMIIIDQEENQGHKQSDQNPRFDGRAVARQLARLHGCRLLFSSHAPSVDIFGDKTVHLLRPDTTQKQYTSIDMRNERKGGNYTQLADVLQTKITETLAEKKKIFLFINKRGSASSVVCKDCGLVMTCRQCQLPLIFHSSTNALYCHRCNTKYEVPPFCPKCSNVDFKYIGAGTQVVEQQAKKLWPQAKISRLDTDTKHDKPGADAGIIIGTEYAVNRIDWSSFGLIGIITADTLLYLPDFRSSERTWQLLNKLSFHTTAPVIVQTYNPEHIVLTSLANNQPDKFYSQEILQRKEIGYPPFTSLVKLIYQHRDKKICLANTQKMLAYLKTSPLKPLLLTPMTPLASSRWRMYIIIKFQSPSQDAMLRKIFSSVPEGWIIDRDPVNLL
jgi:primosomal protein N' (replication factor Y)